MLLWRLPTDRPAPIGTANPPRYRTVLRSPQARYLFLLVGLEGVVVIGVFTYLGAYLESRFGLNSLASGLILACYGAGTLLASRLFGRIGARLRETERVLCGGGLLGAGFLLLRSLSWWPLAVAPFLAMGIGFALFHSTLQTRATELAPEARGTAIAVFAFTLFLGGAIGTTGSGWLVTTHGYTPLLVGAGATMLAITFGARWSWAR
jgi:predicted MFS family arabinose efflux permease